MNHSFFKAAENQLKPTQICVPLVSSSLDELKKEAELTAKAKPDLVEWRVDQFLFDDLSQLDFSLLQLRKILGEIPILLTWRTQREGGVEISDNEYYDLLSWAVGSAGFAMIDVELSAGDELCKEIVASAKKQQIQVILSYHNFEATPPKSQLKNIFNRMLRLEPDAAKIAVMPNCKTDVLELMDANLSFNEEHPDFPTIAIAMGELGQISRIAGNFFESALTFATVAQRSAPGQLSVQQVRAAFEIIAN